MTEKQLVKKPSEFRPGKTRKDHASGAWKQRLQNLQARGDASRSKTSR